MLKIRTIEDTYIVNDLNPDEKYIYRGVYSSLVSYKINEATFRTDHYSYRKISGDLWKRLYDPFTVVFKDSETIDLGVNETIEFNMGGISILNLQDRTNTYTNSFNIPSTPNNEKIFAFYSSNLRGENVEIKVYIQSGSFSKKAKLTVISYGDKVYKCSLKYDDDLVMDGLRELNIFEPLYDFEFGELTFISEANTTTLATKLSTIRYDEYPFYPPMYSTDNITTKNAAYSLASFFNRIAFKLGVTISGSMLTTPDFLNSALFIPRGIDYLAYKTTYVNPCVLLTDFFSYGRANSNIKAIECIKAMAQILGFDLLISDGNIKLQSLTEKLNGDSISVETLKCTNKKTVSGYANTNSIKYTLLDQTIDKSFGSDTITADGVGSKDLFTITATIPKAYDKDGMQMYDILDTGLKDKIVILSKTTASNHTVVIPYGDNTTPLTVNLNIPTYAPLIMDGFYSTKLDKIFSKPILIEADGNIDSITAFNLMDARILTSVKLGGKFWVDAMAYDLNSGKSVLKLIKL